MTIPAADRLLEHVRAEGLFPDPGIALLAVSGGPDSIALLDLMHRIGCELALELAVAHVNHGIAPDSEVVAADVARWAARYGLSCLVRALHLTSPAETRARVARYRALRAMQRDVAARYLVTAHHADDQIETVLLRALKGSGTAGLAGIPATGPGGLVRPLLPFSRSELTEWLGLRYPDPAVHAPIHRDPANEDARHDRSWLRQWMVPLLRDRFGDEVGRWLLALQRHAARDREAWAAAVRAIPGLDLRASGQAVSLARGWLASCPVPLASAVIEAAGRIVGCQLGPVRSARLARFAVRAPSGRRLQLGRGWEGEAAFDRLTIRRGAGAAPAPSVPWGHGDTGCARWGAWEIHWRPGVTEGAARAGLVTWVTPGPGEIRALGTGDRVRPVGGRGGRPARRLLMEARVPRSERAGYPVVTRGGVILWLPGVCRSDAGLPRAGDRAVRLEACPATAPVGAGGDRG